MVLSLKSLAAIGFAADSRRSVSDLIGVLVGAATETIDTGTGIFRVCRLPTGAEVWLHFGSPGSANAGKIVGISPFQVGEAGMTISVMRALGLDHTDPMCGGYDAFLPALKRGDRPLGMVIMVVPFLPRRIRALPNLVHVQMLALAAEATCYPSAAVFLAGAPKERLMSPGAIAPFVSDDFFAPNGPADAQKRTQALVGGRIRDFTRHVNPLTEQAYWSLALETDRGLLNLAVNAASLTGARLERGFYVQAKARLVCRHQDVAASGITDNGAAATFPTEQQAAQQTEYPLPPGAQ